MGLSGTRKGSLAFLSIHISNHGENNNIGKGVNIGIVINISANIVIMRV